MRTFDPREPLVRRWDLVLLVTSAAAVLIDPLFLYILRINDYRTSTTKNEKFMIGLDKTLLISATTLRSAADVFCGLLHVFFKLRTAFPASSSRVFSRVELNHNSSAIARRYFPSFLLVDFLALLPLPQAAQILPAIPGCDQVFLRNPKSCTCEDCLHHLSLHHCCSLGAFWYSFSIHREMDCWQLACRNHARCDYIAMLTFGNDRPPPQMDYSSFLNRTCPKRGAESSFDYGMFADAVKSGVLESANFDEKLLYSFCTLGQNVKPSINSLEICFALCIFIAGLLLFSQVIGIIQTRMLTSTIRIEEMKMKWEDVEGWMSSHFIPHELKRRLRRHQEYRWRTDQGVDFNHVLDNVPKDLRRDVKRHLWLPLLMRVPMFEKMDEQLLDAMCDRLKPALYTEESHIVREGDPVDEMIFVMRGKLLTTTTDGGRAGFFNSEYLKAGDFCGEELLTWALDPHTSLYLPNSTRTVRTITEVEAFALTAEDLKFVALQFRRLHSKHIQHTFRFYSQQWRTWAACFIQAAWRRYRKKKLEEATRQKEDRLQDALAKASSSGNSPSLGATIYASRFAVNVLGLQRRNSSQKTSVPPMLLQKPAEPDFTAHER